MKLQSLLTSTVVLLSAIGCSAGSNPDDTHGAIAADTVGAACPGSDWVYADSWSGLKGTFTRAYTMGIVPSDELSSLAVIDDPTADIRSSVRYSRTTHVAGVETGTLQTLASNPAVGAQLTFDDANGRLRDIYTGLIARSPITKKIVRLCLVKETGADGMTLRDRKPFMMSRVGL